MKECLEGRSVYRDFDKFQRRVGERSRALANLLKMKVSKDVDSFVRDINRKVSSTERAHDLETYLRVLSFTKKTSLEKMKEDLAGDELPKALYKALESWGMNKRRASLKSYSEFREELQNVARLIDDSFLNSSIEVFRSVENDEMKSETVVKVMELYERLKVTSVDRKSKLVGNSKLMHFLFPALIMPIDRTYTIQALGIPDFWPEIEKCAFLTIHRWAGKFAEDNWELLQELVNADSEEGWNQTVPKVLDNLMVYYVKTQL